MKYSYLKTLGKGVKYLIVYSLAFVLTNTIANTGIADLTIVDFLTRTPLGQLTVGSVLVMIVNYLKVKWEVKI